MCGIISLEKKSKARAPDTCPKPTTGGTIIKKNRRANRSRAHRSRARRSNARRSKAHRSNARRSRAHRSSAPMVAGNTTTYMDMLLHAPPMLEYLNQQILGLNGVNRYDQLTYNTPLDKAYLKLLPHEDSIVDFAKLGEIMEDCNKDCRDSMQELLGSWSDHREAIVAFSDSMSSALELSRNNIIYTLSTIYIKSAYIELKMQIND